jgi:hypothetical protein
MNVDNIPESIKRVMGDKSLTMNQKMTSFMAFMPNLPDDTKVNQYCKDNLKVGIKIKRLLDEKKISTEEFHDALRKSK